jgi:hypothetical protein
MTKAQAEAWKEANRDKKVWIIDRNDFYSTIGIARMKLIETRISIPVVF